jgi:hypothetical protein
LPLLFFIIIPIILDYFRKRDKKKYIKNELNYNIVKWVSWISDDFFQSNAITENNGKYGFYIDKKSFIEPMYDEIGIYKKGMLSVKKDEK